MKKQKNEFSNSNIENLTFMDAPLKYHLLKDKKCVYEMIRIILGRSDFSILDARSHVNVYKYAKRPMYFDGYAKLSDGLHVNIQIIRNIPEGFEKMVYYYSNVLNIYANGNKEDWRDFDPILSVWFMGKDYFHLNRPHYYVKELFLPTNSIVNMGHNIILVNTEASKK